MIAAVVATMLAVYLLVPGAGDLRRVADASSSVRVRRQPRWLGPLASLMGIVGAAAVIVGRQGAVVGWCCGVVGITVFVVARRHRHQGRARARRTDVAQAALALAAESEIGRVPREALTVVAADFPILAPVEAAARLGGSIPTALRDIGARPGAEGLGELAAAWQLGERVGAPMAGSFRQVATSLAEQRVVVRTVKGELAAPRATGRLLAALPLGGIGLGFFLGGNPLEFLLENVFGNICVCVGFTLSCLGLLWSERLADKAGQ